MSELWRTGLGYLSRLREARIRRMVYAVLALLLALLCIFPRPYVARVKLLPQGEGGSLASMLGSTGGLQNFAALLGNHQSIEVYLAISRSENVLADAVRRLQQPGRSDFSDSASAEVKLARKVDVNALAGGIVEIDARDYDPAAALQMANAYSSAVQNRLLVLAREHIAQKKAVLADRMANAVALLTQAENGLNAFQSANKLAAPPVQLGAAVTRQAGLEAALQVKQVELSAASRFGTGQNIQVMAIESEIASLRNQIAQSETSSQGPGAPNLSAISLITTQYIDLYRKVQFAQALVEAYARYGEEIAVEDISTTTDATVQIVEEPNVDPRRQYNIVAIGLLLALLVLAFYTELYIPVTQSGDGPAVER